MGPVIDVTAAHKLWGTVFLFEFSDGSRTVTDLARVAKGPVFDELVESGQLGEVRVDPELGTIVWPNGADIAPTALQLGSALSSNPGVKAQAAFDAARNRKARKGPRAISKSRVGSGREIRSMQSGPLGRVFSIPARSEDLHYSVNLEPFQGPPGNIAVIHSSIPESLSLYMDIAGFGRDAGRARSARS